MKKILIVDDDKIFLKIFKDTIEKTRAGEYEVVPAVDGEDALARVDEVNPDIIVLDIQMPRMDGIAFLRKIKKRQYNPEIPVLISSNFSDVDKVSEGIELGVKGYVVKSDYSLEGIIQQIDNIFEDKSE